MRKRDGSVGDVGIRDGDGGGDGSGLSEKRCLLSLATMFCSSVKLRDISERRRQLS